MLLPTLSKARERARTALCASNLKQIILAWRMYLEDYNEILPPARDSYYRFTGLKENDPGVAYGSSWVYIMRNHLNMPDYPSGYWAIVPEKYRNGILKCPSMRVGIYWDFGVHYGMPICYIGGYCPSWGWDPVPYFKYPQIKYPSRQIVFCDSCYSGYGGSVVVRNNEFAIGDEISNGRVHIRHNGNYTANFAFADGHVESMTYKQALTPDFDYWYRYLPWGKATWGGW